MGQYISISSSTTDDQTNSSGSSSSLEAGLDTVHHRGADPEGLGEHVGGHIGGGPEEGAGDELRPGELAVEGRDGGGGHVAGVALEVHEAAREHEELARGDGLGEENVGGGDEAHVEGAGEDEDDLGGARVRVRRVDPAGGEVGAGERDALGVEPRDHRDVGVRDHGAHGRDLARGSGAAAAVWRGECEEVGEEVVGRGDLNAREPVHPHPEKKRENLFRQCSRSRRS
jgi:hypothetical protein